MPDIGPDIPAFQPGGEALPAHPLSIPVVGRDQKGRCWSWGKQWFAYRNLVI